MTSDLDPDRVLALSYVPATRRPALEALWRLDAALGAVLAGGREPMISRIKLAWWREALEQLNRKRAPEPVLKAVAEHVLSAGIGGAALAAMVEGWEILLSPEPLTDVELDLYAQARGGLLFRHSARLLGGEAPAGAGARWALVDLARHSANQADRESALAAARALPPPGRWAADLRPLGMLDALAARDAAPERARWEAQGSPARMLRMLRLRVTGR
jgi:phytoene synthase